MRVIINIEAYSKLKSTYLCIVRELMTMGVPLEVAILHNLSIKTSMTIAYSSERPEFIET